MFADKHVFFELMETFESNNVGSVIELYLFMILSVVFVAVVIVLIAVKLFEWIYNKSEGGIH